MREGALIGFAVILGIAGAAIMALPLLVWMRRRKAAAAMEREFLEAVPAVIGFRYRREKKPFGEGFADAYEGQVGDISFRLDVDIVPFRKAHVFRLRLEKRVGGEPLVRVTSSSADPTGTDPLARAAASFRHVRAKREGYLTTEAD